MTSASYALPRPYAPPPIQVSRNSEPVGTLRVEHGDGWHPNTVWGDPVTRPRVRGAGHIHIVMYIATGERLWARDDVLPAAYDG